MTYWKTHDFKALQREWYKRLSESGFEDVEEVINDELRLKQRSQCRRRAPAVIEEEKAEYYQAISFYVGEFKFEDIADKVILTLHAEGLNACEISRAIKELGYTHHRNTIYFVIRRYQNRWGIRKWSPKQLRTR